MLEVQEEEVLTMVQEVQELQDKVLLEEMELQMAVVMEEEEEPEGLVRLVQQTLEEMEVLEYQVLFLVPQYSMLEEEGVLEIVLLVLEVTVEGELVL
jgi:hypothetical protein